MIPFNKLNFGFLPRTSFQAPPESILDDSTWQPKTLEELDRERRLRQAQMLSQAADQATAMRAKYAPVLQPPTPKPQPKPPRTQTPWQPGKSTPLSLPSNYNTLTPMQLMIQGRNDEAAQRHNEDNYATKTAEVENLIKQGNFGDADRVARTIGDSYLQQALLNKISNAASAKLHQMPSYKPIASPAAYVMRGGRGSGDTIAGRNFMTVKGMGALFMPVVSPIANLVRSLLANKPTTKPTTGIRHQPIPEYGILEARQQAAEGYALHQTATGYQRTQDVLGYNRGQTVPPERRGDMNAGAFNIPETQAITVTDQINQLNNQRKFDNARALANRQPAPWNMHFLAMVDAAEAKATPVVRPSYVMPKMSTSLVKPWGSVDTSFRGRLMGVGEDPVGADDNPATVLKIMLAMGVFYYMVTKNWDKSWDY